MSDQILIRTDENAVATLSLNAPQSINALSDAMLDALQGAFDALKGDKSVRAVILRGNGRAFCAGHDLKEITKGRQAEDGGKGYFEALFATCGKMMVTISEIPQPVIAEVHGIATAAGCQLVASCDMAIAAEGTRFGVNGVNIGLFCSTPMVALTRNIGPKHAMEMLTTGEFIDADRACALGLVNRVVSADVLSASTREMAEKIASKSAAAVKIGKQAFYQQMGLPLEDAYRLTGEIMAENLMWRDAEEGISAFLEKRPPKWDQ